MSKFTRRDTIQLGAGALAGATLLRPRSARAQQSYAVKDVVVSRRWWKLARRRSGPAWWSGSGGEVKVAG
jgi:hypothetical protein